MQSEASACNVPYHRCGVAAGESRTNTVPKKRRNDKKSKKKKTGIHTTPHMLRRYFGNMRRDAGWPLEMISEAYGHKHIDTTIKYLNLVDDQLMEASDQYYAKHSALYDVEKLL